MKKFALLLAVAAVATTPAVAASKHKKAQQQESVFAKQSANTMRILRDGAPLVLPSWALPFYFGMGMDTSGRHKKKK